MCNFCFLDLRNFDKNDILPDKKTNSALTQREHCTHHIINICRLFFRTLVSMAVSFAIAKVISC